MRRAPKQRELNFWKRGGRREGAGRPKPGRVSHATRPKFDRITAVHVTLRVREHVWNLRSGRCFRRIAKALNKLMSKRGKVFSDHYHAHLLHTPTEVVRALNYVLTNAQHHYGLKGRDEYTSNALTPYERTLLLMFPLGWLLRIGFHRAKQGRARADTS